MKHKKSKDELWKMLERASSTPNKTTMMGETHKGAYCPLVSTTCTAYCETCTRVPTGIWACTSCINILQLCGLEVDILSFHADTPCAICTNSPILTLRIKI
jgi:hypothetical protein